MSERCTATRDGFRCLLVAHPDNVPHCATGPSPGWNYWGGRCAKCGRPAEEAHESCEGPMQVAPTKDLDSQASALRKRLGLGENSPSDQAIVVAALKAEGDRRAADMRERCAAVSAQYAREGDHPECNAIDAIRSLPLEPTK